MMTFNPKSVVPTWVMLVCSALAFLAAFSAFLQPISTWRIGAFIASPVSLIAGCVWCFAAWRSRKGSIPDVSADRLTPEHLRNLKRSAIFTALVCGAVTSFVLVELIFEHTIPSTSFIQCAFGMAALTTILTANYSGLRKKMALTME